MNPNSEFSTVKAAYSEKQAEVLSVVRNRKVPTSKEARIARLKRTDTIRSYLVVKMKDDVPMHKKYWYSIIDKVFKNKNV